MKNNKDHDTLTFNALKRAGYNFAVTLPCGMLKGLIRKVEDCPDIIHVPLAREEEGVGIAAGAHLGGKKPVMIVQRRNAFRSFSMDRLIVVGVLVNRHGFQY